MTKMTPEDLKTVQNLCAEFRELCEKHRLKHVFAALTVFTTEVLMQMDEDTVKFMDALTDMSSHIFQLFLSYKAAKENGDLHTLQ